MTPEEAQKLLRDNPDGIREFNRRREAGEKIDPLPGIDLSGANLACTIEGGSSGERAKLHGLYLVGADFSDAMLHAVDFRESILERADFTGANLILADFRGAQLEFAELTGADITGCDFRDASLDFASGVLLNANLIRNTRFEDRAPDPWSVLRRTYTGPSLLFNLIFLCAFIGVQVLRTSMWVGVNRAQQAGLAISAELEERARELASTSEESSEALLVVAGALSQLQPSLTERSKEMHVWEVLLALDAGPWLAMLAIALFMYNITRWILTREVSSRREAEERSGVSPHWRAEGWEPRGSIMAFLDRRRTAPRRRKGEDAALNRFWQFLFCNGLEIGAELHGYRWCWHLHRWIARPLFWVAVVAFLWHAWHWVVAVVYLPK